MLVVFIYIKISGGRGVVVLADCNDALFGL